MKKNIIIVGFLLILSFYSCSEILIEKDISSESLILVAPVNNSQFYSTSVTFNWEAVDNAIEYRIQIARPSFDNPLQIVLDTTTSSTSYTQQLPIGQYEWRVKALNSNYQTAYSSRFITIVNNDDFQSNSVSLSNPSNELITKTALQNLSWQSVIGATEYQLQIYDSSSNLILNQNTSNTSYSFTFPEGSFQWKVRATNGTDYTLYSSRSILVDLTLPNTPLLSTPANTAITSSNDISFQWSRTPLSGSTEKDSIYIYTDSALNLLESKTQATSPFSKTLNNGTYYWQVKAFDAAGNSGNVSTTFSFTIN